MKKDTFILILKVLAAIIAAILSVLTVTSCSASKQVDITGRACIVTVDTTFVNHNTNFILKK